jgi:hypothetical protein
MNVWETLALALLQGAEMDAPLFVHSTQGTLIMNASENLLNGAIAALVARQAAQPANPTTTTTITSINTAPAKTA